MRAAVLGLLILVLATLVQGCSGVTEQPPPWVAVARLIRNGWPLGPGVYLQSGWVITAGHLTSMNDSVHLYIAGVILPAKILKQGSLDDVDLTLLEFDEEKLPAGKSLPQVPLCEAPPWPGDPVIVVDAKRATQSHIVSPQVLSFTWRSKFNTLIADVATTGNSGSGVFDPNQKCLLGIMSRKFTAQTTEGERDVAKYFVPAAQIRSFLPAERRESH